MSLGWGIVALASRRRRWLVRGRERRPGLARGVPVLAIVAAAALVCSLPPERSTWAFTVRPALRPALSPSCRCSASYARFGVVVQLMAALLAGIGAERLRRSGTTGGAGRRASARWRSPPASTRSAARHVARRAADGGAPLGHAAAGPRPGPRLRAAQPAVRIHPVAVRLSRLAAGRPDQRLHGSPTSRSLAAFGYTYLLVRADTADGTLVRSPAPPGWLARRRPFDDGDVFAVTAQPPAVYTRAMTGFFSREHDAQWTWRWMGTDASWIDREHRATGRSSRPSTSNISAFDRTRAVGRSGSTASDAADADRRPTSAASPDRSAGPDDRAVTRSRFTRPRRRPWPTT